MTWQCVKPGCAAQPDGAFRRNTWTLINVVLGSICWLALMIGILMYVSRSAAAKKQGKRWCDSHAVCFYCGLPCMPCATVVCHACPAQQGSNVVDAA